MIVVDYLANPLPDATNARLKSPRAKCIRDLHLGSDEVKARTLIDDLSFLGNDLRFGKGR